MLDPARGSITSSEHSGRRHATHVATAQGRATLICPNAARSGAPHRRYGSLSQFSGDLDRPLSKYATLSGILGSNIATSELVTDRPGQTQSTVKK